MNKTTYWGPALEVLGAVDLPGLEQLVEVLGKEGPNKTGDAASVDETAVEQLHERIVTPLQLASDELKKLQAMVEETIDLDSVVCLCV